MGGDRGFLGWDEAEFTFLTIGLNISIRVEAICLDESSIVLLRIQEFALSIPSILVFSKSGKLYT